MPANSFIESFKNMSEMKFYKSFILGCLVYLLSIYLTSEFIYNDDVYSRAGSSLEGVRKIDKIRYLISPFLYGLKSFLFTFFIFIAIRILNYNIDFYKVFKWFLSIYFLSYFGDFLFIVWFWVISPTTQKEILDNFYPLSLTGFATKQSLFKEFMPILRFLNLPELLFGTLFTFYFSFLLKTTTTKAATIYLLGYFVPVILFYLTLYIFKQ